MIRQHLRVLTSGTTSPVAPVKRCTPPMSVWAISEPANEDLGLKLDKPFAYGLQFLICARCFFKSDNVLIVTVTLMLIFPLALSEVTSVGKTEKKKNYF